MRIELYKKFLMNEFYEYFLYIKYLGGKYGLYKLDDLIEDISKDFNKKKKEVREVIMELIDMKLLQVNVLGNKEKYVFLSSRMYQFLYDSKATVAFPDSLYSYQIQDIKRRYIDYLATKNNRTKYDAIQRIKCNTIFDTSNYKNKVIQDTYNVDMSKDFKVMYNYNLAFVNENDKGMNFVLFLVDRERIESRKLIKSHIKNILETVKEISSNMNANKPPRLTIVIPKECENDMIVYPNFEQLSNAYRMKICKIYL